MNVSLTTLAQKRWFVPLLLFLILLIALSSLTAGGGRGGAEATVTEEERLAALCNAVAGVSAAQVMITYDAVPTTSILGNTERGQKICGIAVVCRGGADPAVQLRLHDMLESLYALPSTRISVSGSG